MPSTEDKQYYNWDQTFFHCGLLAEKEEWGYLRHTRLARMWRRGR